MMHYLRARHFSYRVRRTFIIAGGNCRSVKMLVSKFARVAPISFAMDSTFYLDTKWKQVQALYALCASMRFIFYDGEMIWLNLEIHDPFFSYLFFRCPNQRCSSNNRHLRNDGKPFHTIQLSQPPICRQSLLFFQNHVFDTSNET